MADEVNCTQPETQPTLFLAMGERQVSAGGHTYLLPSPFHVFATQNPIEQEGTYPLPEAQLDRFMLMVQVDHGCFADEVAVMHRKQQLPEGPVTPVLDAAGLAAFTALAPWVPAASPPLEATIRLSSPSAFLCRAHRGKRRELIGRYLAHFIAPLLPVQDVTPPGIFHENVL